MSMPAGAGNDVFSQYFDLSPAAEKTKKLRNLAKSIG
jgi:hypothetical protein